MTYSEWPLPKEKDHVSRPQDEPMIRGMPPSVYPAYLKDIPNFLTLRQRELVNTWLTRGREDPHICAAKNPPFDMGSFCWWDRFDDESAFEICQQILCWSPHPGDAVVIGEVCLIRQTASRWLTFRQDIRLGSMTLPSEITSFQKAKKMIGEILEQIQTLGILDD